MMRAQRAHLSALICALVCAPALTGFAAAVPAQGLGRLFSTPEQRVELNRARDRYDPTRQEVIIKQGKVVAPEVEAPPPPLPELMVNGLIRRSDGRSSAWVNGTQLRSGEATADGIVLESDGQSVKFVLPSGSNTSAIKPGQMLDPNRGEVRELYKYMSVDERERRATQGVSEGEDVSRPSG